MEKGQFQVTIGMPIKTLILVTLANRFQVTQNVRGHNWQKVSIKTIQSVNVVSTGKGQSPCQLGCHLI